MVRSCTQGYQAWRGCAGTDPGKEQTWDVASEGLKGLSAQVCGPGSGSTSEAAVGVGRHNSDLSGELEGFLGALSSQLWVSL
jgi:hypothetical protein